jgi:phage terminase large subunit-like protein
MTATAPDLVRPAHLWVPERRTDSAGDEVVDFAETYGRIFDAEQRLVVDALMSERADGKWAALEAGLVCSRQNLKTFTFECIALAKLFYFDEQLVIWSAHLFETAMESFRNIEEIVKSHEHLDKRVKTYSHENGNEGIELLPRDDQIAAGKGGSRLKFRARSKSGGRGLTGDTVILDEAFALQPSHLGALLPTLSARPNPQVLYGSSAGQTDSAVLRNIRDRGRKGGDPSLVYVEFCAPQGGCVQPMCEHAPGTDGCALDDVENWRLANPALGKRISVEYVAAERRALPPEEFARERMGWWDEPLGDAPISLDKWLACIDPESKRTGACVIGLDVSPSLRSAAVAMAGWRTDGLPHGELVKHEPGVDWLAETLAGYVRAKRPAAVVGHGTAQLKALVPSLEAAGVTVTLLTDGDMAAACSQLQSEVAEGGFRHLGDPILADALGNAASKPVGDGGWVWRRKGSEGDITPLVALNAARWGLQTVPKASVPLIAWR